MQQENQLPQHLSDHDHQRLVHWWQDYHISMVSAMAWSNEKGWNLPWRSVNDVFLLMPTVGEVEVLLEGHRDVIRPGRFLLLGPKVRHRLKLDESCDGLQQLAMHCHIHDGFHLPVSLSSLSPCLDVKFPQVLEGEWKTVVHAMNTNRQWGRQVGESFLRRLFQQILLDHPQFNLQAGPSDSRIRDALYYIHRNYADAITVEDLAQQASLKAVQFRQLFKRDVGQSPKAYIASYRLERGLQLLEETHLTVKHIASQVGFENDMYFHLCFKKAFGSTPRSIAKNGRGL